jgi:hypothetical protein
MSVIDVQSEQEGPRGWTYTVGITRPDGRETSHQVTLAWVDHEHWSGGIIPPSKVVEAVIRFLLEREGKDPTPQIPAKFDASTVRRWFPEVDQGLAF